MVSAEEAMVPRALEVIGLTKRYNSITAFDDVRFHIVGGADIDSGCLRCTIVPGGPTPLDC